MGLVLMKTYSATPKDVKRGWYVVDAEGLVLGRLAVMVADRLRGKHKRCIRPISIAVIISLSSMPRRVGLTGNKRAQKTYYRHTGYPGGIKSRTAEQTLSGAHPERVIEKAVQRMLPRGALGRQQLTKLHVYSGPQHPHDGQSPVALNVAEINRKNSIRDHSDG